MKEIKRVPVFLKHSVVTVTSYCPQNITSYSISYFYKIVTSYFTSYYKK